MFRVNRCIYTIAISMLMVGCVHESPTIGAPIGVEPYGPGASILASLGKPIYVNYLASLLSPDGLWLMTNISLSSSSPLVIVSTKNSDDEYRLTYDQPELTSALPFWSPDSLRIAIPVLTQYGRCSDRVLIYQLGDQHELAPSIYELPREACGKPPLLITWAPDSLWLALGVSDGTVFIIDTNGGLQRTASPESSQGQPYGLWWTEDGLMDACCRDQSSRNTLVVLDPLRADPGRTIFASDFEFFVAGFNAQLGQVLVVEDTTRSESFYRLRISLLDVGTGNTSWSQDFQGSRAEWGSASTSLPPDFAALMVRDQENGMHELWVFDWHTFRVEAVADIRGLIGWRSSADGFLVVEGEDPQKPSIYLISPQ